MLALIDRTFQGWGRELYLNSKRYVVHFGSALAPAYQGVMQPPPVTKMAVMRTGVPTMPGPAGDQLVRLPVRCERQCTVKLVDLVLLDSLHGSTLHRHLWSLVQNSALPRLQSARSNALPTGCQWTAGGQDCARMQGCCNHC